MQQADHAVAGSPPRLARSERKRTETFCAARCTFQGMTLHASHIYKPLSHGAQILYDSGRRASGWEDSAPFGQGSKVSAGRALAADLSLTSGSGRAARGGGGRTKRRGPHALDTSLAGATPTPYAPLGVQ